MRGRCLLSRPPKTYNQKSAEKQPLTESRMETGSNTSTVALRVIGGGEKGTLESETVKYGRESTGIGPENDCAGKGQQ
jgi:hypothetical protein